MIQNTYTDSTATIQRRYLYSSSNQTRVINLTCQQRSHSTLPLYPALQLSRSHCLRRVELVHLAVDDDSHDLIGALHKGWCRRRHALVPLGRPNAVINWQQSAAPAAAKRQQHPRRNGIHTAPLQPRPTRTPPMIVCLATAPPPPPLPPPSPHTQVTRLMAASRINPTPEPHLKDGVDPQVAHALLHGVLR